MEENGKEETYGAGNGDPVPATGESVRAGSQSSLSNDRKVSAVVHLAAETDNTTSTATAVANLAAVTVNFTRENENPFLRGSKILRSPTVKKASSIGDIRKHNPNPSRKDSEDKTNSSKESENKNLYANLKTLEEMVSNLNNEVILLKKENEDLKRIIQAGRHLNNTDRIEYHTDEEELEQEINPDKKSESDSQWTLVTRKPKHRVTINMEVTDEDEAPRETAWALKKSKPTKKRKAESSPEYIEQAASNTSNDKTSQNENHKPTENIEQVTRTSVSGNATTQSNKDPKPEKINQPPPINIVGVKDYPTINALMKTITDKDYKLVALNNDVWKVNVPDSETYRTLTMKLNTEKFQWYTYEDKQARPIKVMARGLHHTCESNDIIAELQHKGFDIQDAVNMIKKDRTESDKGSRELVRRGLPLFMLTFGNKENIQKIYNIRAIQNMRVRIEPIRKNTSKIVQCRKCQSYNHTQKYCGRDARCVKCAGKHLTSMCTLDRNTTATCINCKGQHPANYRGCEVAKELQKIRNRARNSDQNQRNPGTRNQQNNKGLYNLRGNASYAEVAKNQEPTTKVSNTGQVQNDFIKTIEALNKKLDEQAEINKLIFDQLKTLSLEYSKVNKKKN